MKTYNYSVSTPTIWASFDYGQVEATSIEQAREKSLSKLKYDFDKVNQVLESADVTKGFVIEFNEKDVQITEDKEE